MESNPNRRMYNNTLAAILQHEGKIEQFLDVVLGFLYDCTDYFRILQSPTGKFGFPPGVAQKIILNVFKKYEKLAAEDEKRRLEEQRAASCDQGDVVPKPTRFVEVNSGDEKKELTVEKCDKKQEVLPPNDDVADEDKELDENAKQLKMQQKAFQSSSDSYNGAVRENYSWSQSIKELDVLVKVQKDITRGKQVKVNIGHTHLSVTSIENGEQKTLVDGDLSWKINVENSCWTLQPGNAVHINLEKVQERWWDSLLIDEPKINIRNIDASRPMEDLGDEEQAKIQELMFNEQQKRLGKATTEQMKIENILKEAWNKEGSPFKGQPFDPSVVNMSSSGDMLFNQQ